MLTRHLYRLDEVRAALLWAIFHKRTTEGMFWVQELLDSQCYTELFQTLVEGWLWSVGISRMEWFRQFWILYQKEGDLEEDELISLAYSLFHLPARDCSVLYLLLKAPLQDPERLPPTPKTDAFLHIVSDVVNTPLKEALLRYMRLGKAVSAWAIGHQILSTEGPTVFWNLLSRIEFSTQGNPCVRHCFEGFQGLFQPNGLFEGELTLELAFQALSVGFLCLQSKVQTKSMFVLSQVSLDPYTQQQQVEWKQLEGRRGRRVFSPPSDCLSWITSRGCNPYSKTTLKELRSLTVQTFQEKGCPFWNDMIEQYNPSSSDDALEDFWDTLFPDDIPDEWSLEDQKKSHGSGVLNLNEKPLAWKLLHKWFFRLPSLLVWNPHSQLKDLCNASCWSGLLAWYRGMESAYTEKKPVELVPQAKLKRFEIYSLSG